MKSPLISSLLNNEIDKAAKILSYDDGNHSDIFLEVVEYIIESSDDKVINNLIRTATIDTPEQHCLINNILYDFCDILLSNYDANNDKTYKLENYAYTLYKGIYNPIYNLYKTDEKLYGDTLINWHIEFAHYFFFFGKNNDTIKHLEIANKLCISLLELYRDNDLRDNLFLTYYNLGLVYREIVRNKKMLSKFDYHELMEDYKSLYKYLNLSFETAAKNLEDEPENFDRMLHYIDSGNMFIEFNISNPGLFDSVRTQSSLWHEDGVVHETISGILGKSRCVELLEVYYNKTKSLLEVNDDEKIKAGYADSNLLYGQYYHNDLYYVLAITFLNESKTLFAELLLNDESNVIYRDKLYLSIHLLSLIYAVQDKMKEAMEAINEMVKLRKSAYKKFPKNKQIKDELATAYKEAARFCKVFEKKRAARKFKRKYLILKIL